MTKLPPSYIPAIINFLYLASSVHISVFSILILSVLDAAALSTSAREWIIIENSAIARWAGYIRRRSAHGWLPGSALLATANGCRAGGKEASSESVSSRGQEYWEQTQGK